jgi:hypothetical protein
MPSDDWNWNPQFAMRFWTEKDAEQYKMVVLARNFHRPNIEKTVTVIKIPDKYL